jgi:cobalamin biosynthesis Mg chelatase CobN
MPEWFKEVNPYALQNIVERMLEAIARGMCDAPDETKKRLDTLFANTDGDIQQPGQLRRNVRYARVPVLCDLSVTQGQFHL